MDTNIAAWMIAGGPHLETHASRREREQLYAFRESQREREQSRRSGLLARIRSLVHQAPPAANLDCCPA